MCKIVANSIKATHKTFSTTKKDDLQLYALEKMTSKISVDNFCREAFADDFASFVRICL